jgi:hypothetical protein
MLYRRVFQIAAVLFLAALLVPFGTAGDEKDKGKQPGGKGHHAMFQKCAKACNDCQRECDSCAHHCTHQLAEGKKEHAKTLRTCQDCAALCVAAAQIVARGGPFSDLVCKACADACQRCGKACNEFKDDEHMKRCADECVRCEKVCREMLEHVGHK